MTENNPFDLLAEGTKEPEPKEAKADKTASKKQSNPRQQKPKPKKTFQEVDFSKYPLSAASGQVMATISHNDTAVPVLKMSLRGWVGLEPLSVVADGGIDDIRKVLDELEKQAQQ